MTVHQSADTKAMKIAQEITNNGPASLRRLLRATGLTLDQFQSGWQHLKQNYAEPLKKVAVWDPKTNTYGLWDNNKEAARGTLNRINDLCKRLGVIDDGIIKSLLAQGRISRRLARAIEMIRDEMDEQAENLEKVF